MPEIPAFHVEAKLHGFRRTHDGVVVSFVLHPAEVPKALALDPLGTRYMLAMAAIGDDEQPISASQRQPMVYASGSSAGPAIKAAAESSGVEAPQSASPAGASSIASQRGKERYFESTPSQQALIRAAGLPKDDKFREWIATGWGVSAIAEEAAADYIRDSCCNGGSRRLIAEDPACYQAFLALETVYKLATGRMAEVR